MGRKKLYSHRLVIGFDTEMYEWLMARSKATNRSVSDITEHIFTWWRFNI